MTLGLRCNLVDCFDGHCIGVRLVVHPVALFAFHFHEEELVCPLLQLRPQRWVVPLGQHVVRIPVQRVNLFKFPLLHFLLDKEAIEDLGSLLSGCLVGILQVRKVTIEAHLFVEKRCYWFCLCVRLRKIHTLLLLKVTATV